MEKGNVCYDSVNTQILALPDIGDFRDFLTFTENKSILFAKMTLKRKKMVLSLSKM